VEGSIQIEPTSQGKPTIQASNCTEKQQFKQAIQATI
jgi:hypothetical protein